MAAEKQLLPCPSSSTPSQQLPLLRRPRLAAAEPSPQTRLSKTASTGRGEPAAELAPSPPLVEERLRAVSTPVRPLPRRHPTPSSPHSRHTVTSSTSSHSPIRHHSLYYYSPSPIPEDAPDDHHSGRNATLQAGYYVETDLLSPVSGPPPFPGRKIKTHKVKKQRFCRHNPITREELKVSESKENDWVEVEEDENELYSVFRDLSLAEEAALFEAPLQVRLRERVISHQNYLKLTGWFAVHVPQQTSLNTTTLTVDHSVPEGRKPHHQTLLELQAMLDSAIAETDNAEMIRGDEREEEMLPRWPSPNPGDIVFQSSTSRYFCGEGRSNSPFDGGGQPLISPSEVAVLESMLEGGYRLSLKAHFLDSLPHLSPLSLSLTHLNLSFNTLRVFPSAVFELIHLQQLRMRNNPIQDIPDDIRRLKKIEYFCISFNLLTSLPSGLFELTSLKQLDVSHNVLQYLSRDIFKLRMLQMLNIEGNELIGLPRSILSLSLTQLYISGNYLHPLLWRENCRHPPQALVDMCCTVVSAFITRTSSTVQNIFDSRRLTDGQCDVCQGPIFGAPLLAVKALARHSEIFPLKSVPVLFNTCSQTCKIARKIL